MALMKCRECGHAVSTAAAACPGCGIASLREATAAQKTMRSIQNLGWLESLILLALLGGIVYWLFTFLSGIAHGYSARSAQASDNPIITTPAELEQAYEANTVAADARFKGQYLIVSGNVVSIETDFQNQPYLTLQGVNLFMHTQAHLTAASLPTAAALRRGAFVTLRCMGAGDILHTPMLRDCSFEDGVSSDRATAHRFRGKSERPDRTTADKNSQGL